MRRLLIGVALLLAACQQGPAAQVPKTNALFAVEQLRAEGDAFLAKADYVNAIEKYRQAIDLDPVAIGPRFALGTAYSFLDKRPEAIVQFQWVMDHAASGSIEYQNAQRWLSRAGAVAAPTAVADSVQRDSAVTADTGRGRLVGRTEWPGLTPQTPRITGMLSLIGDRRPRTSSGAASFASATSTDSGRCRPDAIGSWRSSTRRLSGMRT